MQRLEIADLKQSITTLSASIASASTFFCATASHGNVEIQTQASTPQT